MTRLYLSGPMTGYPEYNYPAFHAEAARLRALGYTVVSPAEIDLVDGMPWADYMKRDIPLMLTCDGVAQMEGWRDSVGALIESRLAYDLGMPVSLARTFESRDPHPCRPPIDLSDMDDHVPAATPTSEGDANAT